MIEGIFVREATRRIPLEPFQGLRKGGLAEIAERKGRQSDAVLGSHLETGPPIEGLEGRTNDHLLDDLKGLSAEVTCGIEAGGIDRWRPSAQAVCEALAHATGGVDRVQVMRSVNTDRKALKHARKKDWPEEAKAGHSPLRKKHADLTEKPQAT